jgi:hypothetical protein
MDIIKHQVNPEIKARKNILKRQSKEESIKSASATELNNKLNQENERIRKE